MGLDITSKGNAMNKKELIDAISKKSKLNKSDSENALNAVISCITDLLANGDSIVLPGFASISRKERAARTGRNPSTGVSMEIPASKTVSFKVGSKLKEAINN
jgi:DNA-binding protein HU-beta